MKKTATLFLFCITVFAHAQVSIDTLAFQDFEITPASPTWTFTGPVIYNSGYSNANAAPANSPLGIGGSRAWETTTNSGGLQLNFDNIVIPAGYDSVRVRFNLAAMNLISTGGGPDNLDYVLTAVSTDGGVNYYNRLRIRGATADNSYWPYSATGVAKVFYQPQAEALFQPVTTGPQTTLGYSTCEIVFPGNVSQIAIRIIGRSSSSTDTWLVDNLVLTGENFCFNSTSSLSVTSCGVYTAPSGTQHSSSGNFTDVIPNAAGCDSIISISLTVNNASTSTLNPVVCGSYTSPSGNNYSSSANFTDTIANATGCDSIISINLIVNNPSASSINPVACGSYLSPAGNNYTSSAIFTDTIPNASGCDSIISVNLIVNNSSASSISPVACGSYLSPAGNSYTASGNFTDTIPNASGCDSIISVSLTVINVDTSTSLNGATLTANASGLQYQWINCSNNNPVQGATSQTFLATSNGSYAVIVTDGSCSDTSSCVLVVSVGTDAMSFSNDFSVFPNPSENTFTLSSTTSLEQAVISVTDVQGRVLFSLSNQNGKIVAIDLSQYESGVYILHVSEQDQTRSIRIMKK